MVPTQAALLKRTATKTVRSDLTSMGTSFAASRTCVFWFSRSLPRPELIGSTHFGLVTKGQYSGSNCDAHSCGAFGREHDQHQTARARRRPADFSRMYARASPYRRW